MSTINRSALVPYAAEQMYDLVNDIEAYPQFLPWCTAATVLARDPHAVRATLCLAKGALQQSFTTRNTLHAGRRIDMILEAGPFQYFNGTWLFQPIGTQGCEVSLHLHFELAHGVLALAFGQVFNQLANSLVDAFCRRAEERYGTGRQC